MPTQDLSHKSAAIQEHFVELTDPRTREVVYPLINIAVCAVICGADDFVAIAKFGRAKKEFLSQFLDLSAGIPSHDRSGAIFAALKPAEFEKWSLSRAGEPARQEPLAQAAGDRHFREPQFSGRQGVQ
jgi:hypothetical protein